MPRAPSQPRPASAPEDLERLRRRDPAAIEQVVRRHSADLLNGALALGLRENAAEELVAETFAAFLDAAPRFQGRSSVKTFLFGILYRKAMERGRRSARELACDPVDEAFERRFSLLGHWSQPPRGPEEETLAREVAELIGTCLQGLRPLERAAFLLKDVEREPSGSVRNALEVKDTHLRVLLFRARNKLRDCLEARWGGR
ncbi:MAG: sigma-70 family RNA polymerase sigma factor [Elusimicrobia bacterium]|nr:sigma-70 family RNA polymerase sigma factor [Elusimicrobiota bacterium]